MMSEYLNGTDVLGAGAADEAVGNVNWWSFLDPTGTTGLVESGGFARGVFNGGDGRLHFQSNAPVVPIKAQGPSATSLTRLSTAQAQQAALKQQLANYWAGQLARSRAAAPFVPPPAPAPGVGPMPTGAATSALPAMTPYGSMLPPDVFASPDASLPSDVTTVDPGYLAGTDATVMGAGADDTFLLIHVNNVPELVQKQGGNTGSLVYKLAPSTVTGKVYSAMKDQFKAKLAEQGVVADVSIVTNPPSGPPPKAEILRGAALGAGLVGFMWLLKSLI